MFEVDTNLCLPTADTSKMKELNVEVKERPKGWVFEQFDPPFFFSFAYMKQEVNLLKYLNSDGEIYWVLQPNHLETKIAFMSLLIDECVQEAYQWLSGQNAAFNIYLETVDDECDKQRRMDDLLTHIKKQIDMNDYDRDN